MSRSIEAAGELLLRAGRDAEKTIGNSIIVLARVVSAPIPLSTQDAIQIYGLETPAQQRTREALEDATGEKSKSIFMFRGYIVDADWDQNPHRFVPDPCEMSRANSASLAKILNTISLCTKVTSEHGYTGKRPKVGDWVNIRLNKIRQPGSNAGSWDTANGDLVGMALVSEIQAQASADDNCDSLIDLFKGNAAPLGALPAAAAPRRNPAADPPPTAPAGHAARSHHTTAVDTFYNKLRSSDHFTNFKNSFLMGLAANAWHESGAYGPTAAGDSRLRPTGNDDAGNPVDVHDTPAIQVNSKSTTRDYCSFGYWQLNVCSRTGAGRTFATHFNMGFSTVAEKAALYTKITTEEFQFEFMGVHMTTLFPEGLKTDSDTKTPSQWAQEIGTKFERCLWCRAAPNSTPVSGRTADYETVARGLTAAALEISLGAVASNTP